MLEFVGKECHLAAFSGSDASSFYVYSQGVCVLSFSILICSLLLYWLVF